MTVTLGAVNVSSEREKENQSSKQLKLLIFKVVEDKLRWLAENNELKSGFQQTG